MAKEIQVTYDCADPAALAAFWAEVLGYRVQPPPEGFADWPSALTAWGVPPEQHNSRSAISDPDGKGPRIFFQRVPEGKTAKNRLHLDVRSAPGLKGMDRMDALELEATRLEALGAKRLYRLDPDGIDEGIIVMADPEDNEFCLD
ncbi:VOC family protein [Streptomyces katrae]|uniref:VOC family protein n=1 Tax=Streptomyces katrae TaxID=68223 RepID=A0ABT7H0N0_9ACTN|nr:VOC family protein [Streptomyces katrae]MDK9499398.1 VOC family protein [Streptomyces katrae]